MKNDHTSLQTETHWIRLSSLLMYVPQMIETIGLEINSNPGLTQFYQALDKYLSSSCEEAGCRFNPKM